MGVEEKKKSKIDLGVELSNHGIYTSHDQALKEMQMDVIRFCEMLMNEIEEFDVEVTFKFLYDYIKKHHRILYSEISNQIYSCYNDQTTEKASKIVGRMLSRIESLYSHCKTPEFQEIKKKAVPKEEIQVYEDSEKAIVKILDHVNLAAQQYNMLKQSDEEYNKKIDKRLEPFQNKITKDISSQLLSMVSIFTALAFLLFGGISSLENLFTHSQMPIAKFLAVGSLWGLFMVNAVFVFLFCIGKMTNLNVPKIGGAETGFQKYAIIWWSDFILLAVMIISNWEYYLQVNNKMSRFGDLAIEHSEIVTIILIFIIGMGARWLYKQTQNPAQK